MAFCAAFALSQHFLTTTPSAVSRTADARLLLAVVRESEGTASRAVPFSWSSLLVVVGALLLAAWGYRRLPLELWVFGAASLLLYLLKQNTISLERHIFSTAPLLMLYGAWFEHHPGWRRFLLGFGSLLLVLYALRFAQGLWIG